MTPTSSTEPQPQLTIFERLSRRLSRFLCFICYAIVVMCSDIYTNHDFPHWLLLIGITVLMLYGFVSSLCYPLMARIPYSRFILSMLILGFSWGVLGMVHSGHFDVTVFMVLVVCGIFILLILARPAAAEVWIRILLLPMAYVSTALLMGNYFIQATYVKPHGDGYVMSNIFGGHRSEYGKWYAVRHDRDYLQGIVDLRTGQEIIPVKFRHIEYQNADSIFFVTTGYGDHPTGAYRYDRLVIPVADQMLKSITHPDGTMLIVAHELDANSSRLYDTEGQLLCDEFCRYDFMRAPSRFLRVKNGYYPTAKSSLYDLHTGKRLIPFADYSRIQIDSCTSDTVHTTLFIKSGKKTRHQSFAIPLHPDDL